MSEKSRGEGEPQGRKEFHYTQSGGFHVIRVEGGYLLSKSESYKDQKENYVKLSAEQAATIMTWEAIQHKLNTPINETYQDEDAEKTPEELFPKFYEANLKNLSSLNNIAPDDFMEELGK